MKKESLFQKQTVFSVLILLMFISNLFYVAIEIYKYKISRSFGSEAEITAVAFSKLEALSTYALIFEIAFLLLSFLGIILIVLKIYRPLVESYFIALFLFLGTMFLLNNVLAWAFDVPAGNMTQLLYAPFILVFAVLIYFLIKNIIRKVKKINYKISR